MSATFWALLIGYCVMVAAGLFVVSVALYYAVRGVRVNGRDMAFAVGYSRYMPRLKEAVRELKRVDEIDAIYLYQPQAQILVHALCEDRHRALNEKYDHLSCIGRECRAAVLIAEHKNAYQPKVPEGTRVVWHRGWSNPSDLGYRGDA
jgi:hypothetical protein